MACEWRASPTCPPSGLGSTRRSDFLRRNRHSNRVSASRGLRFRETGFRDQRKMRRNDPPTVTMPFLRTNRRTDPRQFGAFSYTFRKSPVAHDCVVVDAARIEPVSHLKFPANREINREFCGFWRSAAILTPNGRASSIVYNQIPYATEQGIFGGLTRNSLERTGNLIEGKS